jgi:transglutaminase-like putative cysteine protease
MEIKKAINILITTLLIISLISVVKFTNFIYIATVIIALFLNLYYNISINRNLLTIIAITISVLIGINISINSLVNSLIKIILIFISIKLLEEKKYRDYMQIITLSIFLITSSGLLSLSMIFLLYIFTAIFIVNFLVILLTIYDKSPESKLSKDDLKNLLFKTSIIPIISIPFAMLLFFVIPRTNTPLFDFLGRSDTAKSGFTSNIKLGQISSIQDSDVVSFRAVMKEINPEELYWRSVVFDIYKDGNWQSSKNRGRVKFYFDQRKAVVYDIYLEPTYDKYLVILDKPLSISYSGQISKTENLEYITQKDITQKIHYQAKSIPSQSFVDTDSDIDYASDKSGIPPSILKLARELKKTDPLSTTKNIENYLKANYTYSIQDLPIGQSPIEEFLFNKKKGNCEYFASSMALLLRANDIPARLVGGFLGGYYNKNGGYYLISNKNAHVWVEALIDNRWIRIDPTPTTISNFTKKETLPFWLKTKIYFDYISFYWTKFIINYNFQTQLEIAMKIGSNLSSFKLNIPPKLFLTIPFTIFLIFFFILFKRLKSAPDKFLDQFYKELSKKGVKIDPTLTIYENIESINNEALKKASLDFADEFNKMLFKYGKIEKNTLQMKLKSIKKLKTKEVSNDGK